MKHYYLNPKTRDMLIYDDQEQAIEIVEKIEKVKAWVKGELRFGHFEGSNSGGTPEDANDQKGGYTNHNFDTVSGKVKPRKPRKTQVCKVCSKPGHRSDNPEFHPKAVKENEE